MSASSTSVIELPSRAAASSSAGNATGILGKVQEPQVSGERRLGGTGEANRSSHSSFDQIVSGNFEATDGTVVEAAEKWNSPRINIFRVGATFWSMMIMGANDAAYGALIPYLEKYYDLTYTIVSLVFLSPLAGYVASAALNNWIHLKIGQRGVAMLCSGFHLAAYIINCLHPPYPVLVVSFILAGFGNGLAEGAWNTYVGNLARPSELLGFMHAFYGIGGVVSPLLATSLITKAHLPWYFYYYIMIGLASIEAIALTWSFWDSTGEAYRAIHGKDNSGDKGGLKGALLHRPGARISWISGIFLLIYLGAEVALGGWIVTFMLQIRNGEPFASGMTATGFWLGMTVGRAVLGFVTPKLGVKLSISVYIVLAIGLQLLFWLVPNFYVSAVAVAFQGFFLGPLFPGVILVASSLLPRHQHVAVIGFIAAFAGVGASILPFVVGVLAQAEGVRVLQPIILAFLVCLIALWFMLPKVSKKEE